ncbi:MAG: cytochrome c oxidase subunit 3 family protein [Candidatus Kapaibacterium sp.]
MSDTHSSLVAHQFDDGVQQKQATTLGMWVFLITEIMFFGGLILAYTVYRVKYPEEFHHASKHLDYVMGTVNTCVLLCSSLTMAFAVHAAQEGKRKLTMIFIVVTMVLGAAFLGVKGWEYYTKYTDHLIPGPNYAINHLWEGALLPKTQIFFSLYFAMTGLHAFHMLIGLGLMTWLFVKTKRGRFSKEYYNPVEVCGLYWHFIDIVWIFLFPLLYLIDRSH